MPQMRHPRRLRPNEKKGKGERLGAPALAGLVAVVLLLCVMILLESASRYDENKEGEMLERMVERGGPPRPCPGPLMHLFFRVGIASLRL